MYKHLCSAKFNHTKQSQILSSHEQIISKTNQQS